MALVWEILESNCYTVRRARVPGGWLVTVASYSDGETSVTFYPDPDHEWDGNSL